MISFETFLVIMLATSALTGLVTQAVKVIFNEHNITYRANTLAGVIAAILSAAISLGYCVITDVVCSTHIVVCLVALVFLSWLGSMVGYDKVIQAISQFKTSKKEG